VDRRVFLASVAASVLAAAGAVVLGAEVGTGLGSAASIPLVPATLPPVVARTVPELVAAPQNLPAHFFAPKLTRHALPGGTITGLPGPGNCVALTVDDGASSEVVKLYTEFAARSGMRLTFFINGSRPSWTDNAAALRPLVESGQIQLANHTWSHPDLTKLSTSGVIKELQLNEDFLHTTYGVSGKPYFRPPYGFHNAAVDAAARGIGYPVPVLWYGSLSDSGLITDEQLKSFATQWMQPQHIVIGHANFLPVTDCFDFLADLIRSRQLQPVTLNDYFVS
jgi:peptidoglycan/xylan/chitin deacetylase (PgdA/CDA1 family)